MSRIVVKQYLVLDSVNEIVCDIKNLHDKGFKVVAFVSVSDSENLISSVYNVLDCVDQSELSSIFGVGMKEEELVISNLFKEGLNRNVHKDFSSINSGMFNFNSYQLTKLLGNSDIAIVASKQSLVDGNLLAMLDPKDSTALVLSNFHNIVVV